MLASWHCYGLMTKFLKISSDTVNPIPMVISDSNHLLKLKISEFIVLIRPYMIPPTESHQKLPQSKGLNEKDSMDSMNL